MLPTLNWKELAQLSELIKPEVEGSFVERLIIPERKELSAGYFKGEWALRLTSKKGESFILFSIRARKPYVAWSKGKSPQACARATHSAFDLNLSKHLKGSRLLHVETLPQERVLILWFSQSGSSLNQQLGLIFSLIPAAPEAFLVEGHREHIHQGWRILARSRTFKDEDKNSEFFLPPQGGKAPQNPEVRRSFFERPDSFFYEIEKHIESECFSIRTQAAQKELKQYLKQTLDRIKQSQTSLTEALHEPDWQHLGDLLKSSLGNPPFLLPDATREVFNYETEETVKIPCDPKLSVKEQVEKFYQNQKRKQRRHTEALLRLERFKEIQEKLETTLQQLQSQDDWKTLIEAEKLAQIPPPQSGHSEKGRKEKKGAFWSGKTFTSSDGMTIYVGRNKDENMELTFKIARGNDIWLHVRGKPGAHAIIPIQPGKSASLEALLDAAHLVIYYSGGEHWGKAEVDYTFKKYVKRIKNSTEASYNQNKTLIIQIDELKIKKLLDQHAKN